MENADQTLANREATGGVAVAGAGVAVPPIAVSRQDDPATERASIRETFGEVFRVALPLMVSTGTFSLVLFADRTLLLWHDGASMGASMAGGNLFWTLVCLPVGIASMTGAIVGQYIGANESFRIGRFLWQSVWLSLAATPLFALVGWFAPQVFSLAGQPADLIPLEAAYLRALLLGGTAVVLETALSGFFSGTERTGVIMWVSIASGLLNFVLDLVLIFGWGPIPELGIVGAGWASASSFWFKVVCYGVILMLPIYQRQYRILAGLSFDLRLIGKLLFFGLPAGLMYFNEAGAFAVIVLQIGRLGDLPLRATTMAINFNMVAFIPLVGVSIAASVLVGRHLLQSGAGRAIQAVIAALLLGWVYSMLWAISYVTVPDQMLALYAWGDPSDGSREAIQVARGLLGFVALYVILDATQLITAGALRGAGDTWFVLFGGFACSVTALTIGIVFEPASAALDWWWWMVTLWVWMLAIAMSARFIQGRWQRMRMV